MKPEVIFKDIVEVTKTYLHQDTSAIDDSINRRKSTISYLDSRDKQHRNRDKRYYFTVDKVLLGIDEFKKHYGNPLAEVTLFRTTVALEKESDKVRLSLYSFEKMRKVGKKYFATQRHNRYLTFNTKTKNFYVTETIKSYGSRSSTTVRVNNWYKISKIFNDLSEYTSHKNKFIYHFINEIKGDIELSGHIKISEDESPLFMITKLFTHYNEIKTPDKFHRLYIKYYPGKRHIKKHKGNLVRAIMDRAGLEGKYFNRLINQYSDLDLILVVEYKNLFGEKYVKTINPRYFSMETSSNIYRFNSDYSDANVVFGGLTNNNIPYELTTIDRKQLVKVINDFVRNSDDFYSERNDITGFTGIIYDHLRILNLIREYENVSIKSETVNDFLTEHNAISERYQLYKSSEIYEYLYDERFINGIGSGHMGYEFKLLTNGDEYIKESIHQSNCVRTYIDKYSSIIISVRKGEEWVTTEFNHNGRCIQQRGRFNNDPSESFKKAIKVLSKRLEKLYKKDGSILIPKIKITNKITKNSKIYEIDNGTKHIPREVRNRDDFFIDLVDEVLF